MMHKQMAKVIVLGLDGATFKVIKPLVEEGKLPHLARLMQEGAHGVLRSVIPPITGPAWSVLATGKDPGNLGVFDFINRRSLDDFTLYPIRSSRLAGQAFWDVYNQYGFRVGVLNYPMLVPAYEVDGWMVAGLGASKLHDFVYPPAIKGELDRETDGYEINISFGLPKYAQNLALLIDDMHVHLQKRIKALDYLLSRQAVDVLVPIFLVSDVASHTLWQYWETHGQAAPEGSFQQQMRAAFIELWQALDQAVGHVLEYLAPDGHVLVVSDHGFGESFGVFHINQWLQQEGYLARKSQAGSSSNRLREWLIDKTTPWLGPIYKRVLGSKAQQWLRASILREIDLEETIAFALENSDGYGGIFINHHYAQALGLDRETFVQHIAEKLRRDLIRYGKEQQLPMNVFLSREVYSGEHVTLAPEVLLMVDDMRCSVSYRFEGDIYVEAPHHPMKSGSHRMDGILIAAGPRIESGVEINNARLVDIAPTLLHLSDLPMLADMDGQVLTEMFKPAFQIEQHATIENADRAKPEELVDEQDEDMRKVLQRLTDLGYLD